MSLNAFIFCTTELIRFWAGVYNQELKKGHITIETLELQHLERFSEEQYLRISFA